MQQKPIKTRVFSQTDTYQLEQETKQMEAKLLQMKEMMRNLAKYKNMNEKELQTVFKAQTENQVKNAQISTNLKKEVKIRSGMTVGKLRQSQKPVLTTAIDACTTEQGEAQQTQAKVSMDAYKPSALLKEANSESVEADWGSAFESKINCIINEDEVKVSKFYDMVGVPGLRNKMESNGIWSFSDISKVGEETLSQMYITAARQDKIAEAIKIIGGDQEEKGHNIVTQTENFDEVINIVDQSDLSSVPKQFLNSLQVLMADNVGTEVKATPKPTSVQAVNLQLKQLVFDNSPFDFGSFLTTPSTDRETLNPDPNLPKNIAKMSVCTECLTSFQQTEQLSAEESCFCDEACANRYKSRKFAIQGRISALQSQEQNIVNAQTPNAPVDKDASENLLSLLISKPKADSPQQYDLDFDFTHF